MLPPSDVPLFLSYFSDIQISKPEPVYYPEMPDTSMSFMEPVPMYQPSFLDTVYQPAPPPPLPPNVIEMPPFVPPPPQVCISYVTQHHEMRRIWEKGEKNKTLVS
jgi:hypothetical protein